MSTTITGYSDDIIVVEGDIEDELYPKFNDPRGTLFCSDGTILSFEYNGIWEFVCHHEGTLFDRIEKGDVYADRFDIVHFKDGLKFVHLSNKRYNQS